MDHAHRHRPAESQSFIMGRALNLVVLALLLMLVVGLLASGVLRRSEPPAGLAQALSGPAPPPVKQRAATACFMRSVAGGGDVQLVGAAVLVRFADQTRPMKVQIFPTEKAAIRFSYEHGEPNRVYDIHDLDAEAQPLQRR